MPEPARLAKAVLGAPETRLFLRNFVKRRVSDSDVDDVVQTVLVEALASGSVPETETEIRKWLIGVARHKVADLHRRGGRELPSELAEQEPGPPAPLEERGLVQWAEKQTGGSKDAEATLRWMAREGEGDKLEHIAEEERIPAATVRQRVSRMRRWMKERWLAELAAVAALGTIALVLWRFVLGPKPVEIATPEPLPTALPTTVPTGTEGPTPIERGRELRRAALEACGRGEARPCLEGLDRARDLDPAGDGTDAVEKARKEARDALELQKRDTDALLPVPTVDPDRTPQTKQYRAPKVPPKPVQTSTAPAPPSTGKPAPFDSPKKGKPTFDKSSSSFDVESSDDFSTATTKGGKK